MLDRLKIIAARAKIQLGAGSISLFVILLLLQSMQVTGGAEPAGQTQLPVPLFRSTDTLPLTITAPWRQIIRNKNNQSAYPATLLYIDSSGQSREIHLTVERRGVTRQRVCEFPPIKLRFARDAVAGTLFAGNKSIKMVTHCDPGRRWDHYYILEMLAYRMYNLITDRSFRVRPLQVSYQDSQREEADESRFAFLIEDDKLVAGRNGLKKSDALSFRPDDLESLQSSRLALFQYLIGNVDWSVLSGSEGNDCCHNSKPVVPDAGTPVYALPYDFDSSGMVDAHYAAPNESLPIRYVTQRLYRGFCAHNDTLEKARAELLAQRQAVMSVIEQEPGLRERTREKTLDYLQEFFDVLSDDKSFQHKIINACRK